MSLLLILSVVLLVVASLYTVLARSLVGAAISLGLASLLLSVAMFAFAAPLAAVFELSVCAGLITVVFVSTVALTRQQSGEELAEATARRLQRYWPLLALLVVGGLALVAAGFTGLPASTAPAEAVRTVGEALWRARPLEILGQVLVLLAGVLGIVVLFKQRGSHE